MTLDDFQAVLRAKGMDRLAHLVGKYPDEVKPYLGTIEAKLRAKGLISDAAPVPLAPVPMATDATPAEELVLPLLRELDAALSAGGPDAAMQAFHRQIKSIENRNAYLAVLAA